MIDIHEDKLDKLLRLTEDNNRMLHHMRRNAFIGGLIKFILYALIFIVAPIWVYTTYLAPIVQQMTNTMNQIQGTGARVQTQFDGFQQAWKDFESKLPFMQPKQ